MHGTSTWNETPAQHLGAGDLIRAAPDWPVVRIAAVHAEPEGLRIELEDPHDGEPAGQLHALPHDEYSRSEPIQVTLSPEAVEWMRSVAPDEPAFRRLEAGPMRLSVREADEAIAALEGCLERPGPGAVAPVAEMDDDTQRGAATGSLANLWDDLRTTAAHVEECEAAGIGW